tara:strand:- start:392 stop:520 length:129 start_codon:yes stop_codon:yes gene_type:complete
MIIVIYTDMAYKKVKYGLGNATVGDYQHIMIVKMFGSMYPSI